MKIDKNKLTRKNYKKNEIIINAGMRNDYVYFLVKGQIEVIRYSLNGDEEIIYTQKPESIFGEVELFNEDLPSFNVTAKTDVEVMVCSKSNFVDYMLSDKNFLKEVYSGLVTKLLHSSKKQLDFYRKPLQDRIEFVLDEHYANNTLSSLTKRELCQKVSAPVRSVNRALNQIASYSYTDKQFHPNHQ